MHTSQYMLHYYPKKRDVEDGIRECNEVNVINAFQVVGLSRFSRDHVLGVYDVQLIRVRDVQIVKYDPFSSFPGFNKIKAYE